MRRRGGIVAAGEFLLRLEKRTQCREGCALQHCHATGRLTGERREEARSDPVGEGTETRPAFADICHPRQLGAVESGFDRGGDVQGIARSEHLATQHQAGAEVARERGNLLLGQRARHRVEPLQRCSHSRRLGSAWPAQSREPVGEQVGQCLSRGGSHRVAGIGGAQRQDCNATRIRRQGGSPTRKDPPRRDAGDHQQQHERGNEPGPPAGGRRYRERGTAPRRE